nr:9521_t:CDS:2 [Entrophospora candida]
MYNDNNYDISYNNVIELLEYDNEYKYNGHKYNNEYQNEQTYNIRSRSVNENVNQSISRSGSINKSIVGSVVGSEVGSGSGSINENESSGSNASFSSSRKPTSAVYEHYNFFKWLMAFKNFGDSSTTTLWRHFNNNHSKK